LLRYSSESAIFLEINALVIGIMIVCLLAHEATAIWDVSYAYRTRELKPTEQHVHAFLEMLPLIGLLIVVTLPWQQFLSLFGLSQQAPEVTVQRRQPLPWIYVSVILSLVVLFEVLPYLEELVRGIRAQSLKLKRERK
jgi:ABC-type spermidine/putrescine transport system permease subunit I